MTRKKRDGKHYSAALLPESSLDFGDGSHRRRRRRSRPSRRTVGRFGQQDRLGLDLELAASFGVHDQRVILIDYFTLLCEGHTSIKRRCEPVAIWPIDRGW